RGESGKIDCRRGSEWLSTRRPRSGKLSRRGVRCRERGLLERPWGSPKNRGGGARGGVLRPPAIGGTFRSTGVQPPPVVLRGWLARRDKESWKRQKGPGRPLRAPSTQRSVPPASWSRSRPRRFSYGGCFSGVGSPLAVSEPVDGELLQPRRIYLAPRDMHMVVEDGRVLVNRGPKEHHTRPAVDPLFSSAAAAHGPRVVGVLLSGAGDDGLRGLIAIKAAGGISIVQDPAEALHPSMPRNAIVYHRADSVLPVARIGA